MRFMNFEITKREVITSIVIFSIMFSIGLSLMSDQEQKQMDHNEIYNKAVKIESQDIFQYGLRTNIGNAFVSGNIVAKSPVSYPEVDGKYAYIEKVKEVYTMHTRRVAHTRTINGKSSTYYTTEIYWTWDYHGKDSKNVSELIFNGVTFPFEKIDLPGASYIDTIYESGHVRYRFYGVKSFLTGTIFTNLKDGTISDNSMFYENMSIDETYNHLIDSSKYRIIILWIIWTIITGALIFAFVSLENRWLY